MSERRPGQWPAARRAAHDRPDESELYAQRAAERSLHEMVLSSIRHDLEQQPSPLSVLTSARNWCTRITVVAEDIAKAKRAPG